VTALPVPAAVVACPRCAGSLLVGGEALVCASCGIRLEPREGIWTLGTGSVEAGYDPHYFDGISEVEERHFWFVVRRATILDALRRHVPDLAQQRLFDIGCGTGGLVAYLAANGIAVEGACDSYVQGLRLARRRLARAPLFLVAEDRLPPLAPGRDLVTLFDVLEHVDDDLGLLRHLADALRPGGTLALTVPAHPFLYDEADRLAKHRRRYRRAELRQKLEAAGLRVVRLTHFMASLVPAMTAARALGRVAARWAGPADARREAELRVVPGLNGLLRGILEIERAWLRRGSFPFGTSLLAIARRTP
jgi:2-polyprenyl-3-methyl-5-hydroxy-6-metoxy-1,4-benzoquinol methylase